MNVNQTELSNRLIVLDRWFTYFLREFSEKMETIEQDHPINRLYNDKFKEYSSVKKQLNLLKMKSHV